MTRLLLCNPCLIIHSPPARLMTPQLEAAAHALALVLARGLLLTQQPAHCPLRLRRRLLHTRRQSLQLPVQPLRRRVVQRGCRFAIVTRAPRLLRKTGLDGFSGGPTSSPWLTACS